MPKAVVQKPAGQPKASGVVGRLAPISQLDDGTLKIAIYGRSGAGKTTFWSSFPKPICAALCSGAGETKSIVNVKDVQAVHLQDEEELRDLVDYQRRTGKFKTFVLDHATGYQDLGLKKVLKKDELPAQMGWGVASQQDWQAVGSMMKERFRDALSLPCNVVLVSQERDFNTEQGSEVLSPYVSCACSPSVTGWIGPNVDYLVQAFIRMGRKEVKTKVGGKDVTTYVERPEYCLRTGPHPVYQTKFRVTKGSPLPDVIVDASYDKVMAIIEGQKT